MLPRWGWVRAVGDALCPEQVAAWAVYDEERRRWAQDPAFSVRCLLGSGEVRRPGGHDNQF